MAKGNGGSVSGRHVLARKLNSRLPKEKRTLRTELKGWGEVHGQGLAKSKEERIMREGGLSQQEFLRLHKVYFNQVRLNPHNAVAAQDVLANEVARKANVPFSKASVFVGKASWVYRKNIERIIENAKKKA